MHRFLLPRQHLFDLGLPRRRVRLDVPFSQRAVGLGCRFIKTQLYHGEIGGCGLKIFIQTQILNLKLGFFQFHKRVAKMDEQQITLMSEEGKQRALPGRVLFHWLQNSLSF